ncbi:hypothetical protein FDP41_009744 [Naegleria fowleri]|uniref:ribose-phosphate diphosphokinase n=1 Tax=Naegleria fowleri TaxID=5763 RepID=A0A6A5BDQ4_NAEFO|nr:uncharacterized protein FDP41_009744 [Naegleria fowleri]KAF0972048.1 hypothetical protein FDP41_009744 [Naegleria fowleri]CAG4718344.1 unnamed protein product [Naegleria fowleri]
MGFNLKIVGGTSNVELAKKVAEFLQINLTETKIYKFADSEIGVQIMENVRGVNVYVIQSTCTPVNDNFMELCLIVDALKRASCNRITAVVPYYGYARQDRKTKPRVPISAALVSRLLESSGVDRVLSVDLHCGQIQGFFNIPVDNLHAKPVLVHAFHHQIILNEGLKNESDYKGLVVVSPDAGGAERADNFRTALVTLDPKIQASMAVMNKKRLEANKVATMELVGNVEGKHCVIVDDMIDTAGTLVMCAQILKDNGAKRIFACATHGLFNGTGVQRIQDSVIEKVIVTNTVPLAPEKQHPKIIQVCVSELVGEAIRRVHNEESVSSLF